MLVLLAQFIFYPREVLHLGTIYLAMAEFILLDMPILIWTMGGYYNAIHEYIPNSGKLLYIVNHM